MIGKIISHYLILSKLGEGGMGVVYKAEDTRLKRTVALKFLPSDLTRDEDAKERFIHEAQAASALQHNNICNIHDIDQTDEGRLYIVMDCYEGELLKEKIANGPIKIEEALDIIVQTSSGLLKAHEKGLIHRDIKPANIFITNDGVVKILDFGLAKLGQQTKLTKTGATLGTVAYMSPEQARGEEVDYRTDIWSLGVVVYEMITGRPPFKGEFEHVVVYGILNEKPEPPTGLRSSVPLELERITMKALTKNPDERYQHLDDLLADIRTLNRTKESGPKIIEPREQKSKPARSRYFYVGLSLLVISMIAVFAYFALLKKGTLDSTQMPIAVLPFENRSGNTELNPLCEMVQDLLITKLGNSKFLNVMTRERMNDLLKQMGKQGSVIDKELGFELCHKDGVETVVVGSVNKADETFVTDVKVLDVESKKLLKSATAQGQGVSSILKTQIDELSKEISRSIGLTAAKIAANQQPIEEVTTSSTEAYQYYLKGKTEFENSNWEDARVLLEKAVTFDSTFAIAQLYLGYTYSFLRNSNSMYLAYKRAKDFSHKAPTKERLFIEAFYALHIAGNQEEGFRIFRQMVKTYPKEKFPHLCLGWDYMNNQMYSEAITEYNKALELDPKFGWAYGNLSYACASMGDTVKAIQYLKQYASAVPGNANPFDKLGNLYFQLGQMDDAISNYQEALQITPEYGSNWKLAYIYALKENYPEAMRWINNYIMVARSPGPKAEGLGWLAIYYSWFGKYELALSELTKLGDAAEKLGNLYASASKNWIEGWMYFDLGDYRSSRKCFNRVCQLRQQFVPQIAKPLHICYTGLIAAYEGKIDSVELKLTEIETLLPNVSALLSVDLKLYYGLISAEAFLAQNSLDNALASWNKVVWPIPPMDIDLLASYNVPFLNDCKARIYIKKGDIDKAIAEYNRLLNLNSPSHSRRLIHPKLHYRLAKLYQEKGDKENAINEYKNFLDLWKEADQDLPELIDAKVRYANLRRLN